MKHHLILRVIAKFIIPLIVLFALYVQFHGDYGPGGGFQAGVIFGAAFILYTLVFGLDTALKVLPMGVLRVLASLGVGYDRIDLAAAAGGASWTTTCWGRIRLAASTWASSSSSSGWGSPSPR